MNDFNAYRNPRLAEAIRRAYGEELDVSTIAPELSVGISLESDRFENRILQGLRYWTTGPVTVAASVGNFSRVQIHNPGGSGILVVVEGFTAYNPPAVAGHLVTIDGALAGAPTANLALDARVPASVGGTRKVASLNRIDNALPAASGVQIDRRVSQVGIDVIFDFAHGGGTAMRPIVLTPNTVCEIVQALANTQLIAVAYGYERQARPEELVLT